MKISSDFFKGIILFDFLVFYWLINDLILNNFSGGINIFVPLSWGTLSAKSDLFILDSIVDYLLIFELIIADLLLFMKSLGFYFYCNGLIPVQ